MVVRRELEDSLRRLGVDHIDLYQVHYPDTGESRSGRAAADPADLDEIATAITVSGAGSGPARHS
ncbi:aldo/keto reductase [Nocardia terpenica]|uniref:NADP-dependent oxidoreductase domain-containing protein n=1 Tax=Nocardia terpenica TaxID=455432 RepID=A0A164LRA3_9NOCA|nr:aldo/keto reductase [Nocardia terpenica]KZM72680.1 hypothetical protein AWN90_28270 [Nocardia terpenica]